MCFHSVPEQQDKVNRQVLQINKLDKVIEQQQSREVPEDEKEAQDMSTRSAAQRTVCYCRCIVFLVD